MFEKEALELEAEEKAKKRTKRFACQENCEKSYVMGALDFAEPREKRIEELTEWLNEASDGKLKLQMLRADLVSKIGNQEKRIAELEEKISVLLSCKDCPENKDGLICQKEYENKCLAQKMQFIKELQQENAELKGQVETSYKVYNDNLDYSHHIEEQLAEAKKIIEELYNIIPASMSEYAKEPMEHARKFMTEEADK